jgi:hypothetical protein
MKKLDDKTAIEILSSSEKIEEFKRDHIFDLLNSKEELRDWMYLYFDINFPMGVVYPTSTHGPVDAMWRIYELVKTGESRNVPQVVMIASRDSYKTLSAAAIEVLLFIHFRLPMAHAAAIKFQAGACVNYVNTMFRKIRPYLEAHGWNKTSDNKTLIEWRTSEGDDISLMVLTATKEGFNSRHCPYMCLDELDLMDPSAFSESRMVPSIYKGHFPLIVILSTLKYSAGLMSQEIARTPKIGGEVFKWNIIDVTERITPSEAGVGLIKTPRYISTSLPMRNLSIEEWSALNDNEKVKYEYFEAHPNIAKHSMLPVMKHYLVDRNQDDHGFLYKPLTAVHNNFKVTTPDMAEAQLLCNRPSASGLVYSRFDEALNTISIQNAWEFIEGTPNKTATYEQLTELIKKLGATIIGGADWGFTDFTSLVVLALLPTGKIWLVDSMMDTGWELDDIVKRCVVLQEKWNIDTWYVDQNYPAYIKTLRKKGLKVPDFTKVVADGISALQSRIVDASNVRRFFVLDIPENKAVIEMFGKYKWSLDGKGDIIDGKPYHDKEGWSDIADSIRYPMQNLFSKNKMSFSMAESDKTREINKAILSNTSLESQAKAINEKIYHDKMTELVENYNPPTRKNGKKILFM